MSDVFSFGLLLEIVSGRRNTSFYDGDRFLNLIGHVSKIGFTKFLFQLLLHVTNLTKILPGMGVME